MFPEWLEALVLGVVQGLTEFIPVSSSGHLVLVPYLFGFEERSLAFDVLLHVGTLGAVVLYLRAEIAAIARGILGLDTSEQGRIYRRVGLMIVPASIPVAVVGLTLEARVAEVFESPLAASLLLLVTAALLIGLERVRDRRVVAGARATVTAGVDRGSADPRWAGDWRDGEPLEDVDGRPQDRVALPLGVDRTDPLGDSLGTMSLRQAMVVGLLQCLAVLPGISRSGSTIAGGVFAGLTREAATRFSFLLVIPALVGATALSLGDLDTSGASPTALLTGVVASFVSGYAAIRFLVALVSRERLTGFAYYCIAASAVGLIGYAMIGPPSAL